ncbi:MAG: TolC family protein [Muribaculaceae bacterium]|nr:TolC family protein [Muribaculaceae bacterium]
MNNHRLLTGLLAGALLSGGVCSAQSPRVLTLSELYESAEANSTQLRPAFTAIEEAEKAISTARANRLPDISASLSVSYIGDGFTTQRNFSDYQRAPIPHLGTGLGVNVTQPLFTGGAITEGIRMAEIKADGARQSADLQRNIIRFQLTDIYLNLYKYSNLQKVIESNLTAARRVLDDMKARYEQGTALLNDITRYELLISNIELEQIRIGNMLDILNTNLTTIAGLPSGTQVVPDSTILDRSLPQQGEEWWQMRADENSPQLALARTGVSMSQRAEKLTRAERLPKIGLQAGWTMDGPILVEIPPINRNLSYWYVGLGVSYNLSSLFKTNKAMAQSRVATIKAQEELEAAGEQISLEVRADHIKYMEAYEELTSREKAVELALRNYHTTSTRYQNDMALITDMLDAANSRLDAEQQLINARINIIYCYYKLLFTSGKI